MDLLFAYQTILLNRIYKTNAFTKIKPKVYSEIDRVIYVLPAPSEKTPNKLGGGTLTKLNKESGEYFAEEEEVFQFFDMSQDDIELIKECHKIGTGIEGQIYLFT